MYLYYNVCNVRLQVCNHGFRGHWSTSLEKMFDMTVTVHCSKSVYFIITQVWFLVQEQHLDCAVISKCYSCVVPCKGAIHCIFYNIQIYLWALLSCRIILCADNYRYMRRQMYMFVPHTQCMHMICYLNHVAQSELTCID